MCASSPKLVAGEPGPDLGHGSALPADGGFSPTLGRTGVSSEPVASPLASGLFGKGVRPVSMDSG